MNSAYDTYYEVLKVDRKATISEIVAAYHSAKNAFSKDSVATYSLFSSDEIKGVLDRLEEAYLTLSNLDKKREYDLWLSDRSETTSLPPMMTERDRKQNAQNIFAPVTEPAAAQSFTPPPAPPVQDGTPINLATGEEISGVRMREIREKRGLSVDDVARITKIPTKFIRALETDDFKHLPARVYLQGFLKNMATLYKIDPKIALKNYFDYVDRLQAPAA